jgi:O-antigen ligase
MVRSLLSPETTIDRVALLLRPAAWLSALYVVAVLFSAIFYLHGDSRQALILLVITVLGPVALYATLRAPLIFPFCAYILVLPFDSLSSLGSGGTLAKLLGVLTAGAILVRVLRRGRAISPPGAVAGWATLLVWMAISMFWALDVSDAMRSFQMYGSLIMLFVLLSVIRVTYRELNTVLGCVVLAGLISAAYDAYLYHSGQSLIAANSGVSRVMITVGDASIDPNALASALVLPTAIAIYWLFNSRHLLISILMPVVIAVLLLGFAASGSRGGFIQLGVVFAYLIILSRHRLWLCALTIIAIVTTLVANPGLPARFADAQQDGGAGRRDVWHVGIYAFRDHWLAGAGVGNFPDAFDREYMNVYTQYVLGWHWVAHNVPLGVATELGVIGLVIFLIAIFRQFRLLRALKVKDASRSELRLTLEGACLGIFVSGLSSSNLNAKYVWLAFGLMSLYRGFLVSEGMAKHLSSLPPARSRLFAPVANGKKASSLS